MASGSDHGSPTRADLFTGLKFWLSHQVPMKSYYRERLLEKGATIVAKESLADVCIVDDARKNLPTGEGYYSYKFVDESIKRRALANLEDYVVNTKSRADRQVGSGTVAAKGKRNPFTKEDDQILSNWLEPFRHDGGKWKGNEIYKQLEREHPQHTFQSWRHRYITLVEQGVRMIVTEPHLPSLQPDEESMALPQGRSPKRRRLNDTQPATLRNDAEASHQRPTPILSDPGFASRKSPLSTQSPKISATGEERDEIAGTVDGRVKDRSMNASASSERPSSTNESVELRGQRPQNVTRENGDLPRHQVDGQADEASTPAVSSEPRSIASPKSASSEPGNPDPKSQPPPKSRPVESISYGPKFSREDQQSLYKAVPYIYNVSPELRDNTWKTMATEGFGHHTWAEWRDYYQNAIIPEYMRRNNLHTEQDLDDHVQEFLAEEQLSQMQQKQEVEEEQNSGEEDESEGEGSDMFFRERRSPQSASDGNAEGDRTSDESLREASPELGLQMVLRAIEIKESGRIVLEDSHLEQSQQMPPPEVELSVTPPKKKLFGRTLDTDMASSQVQVQVQPAVRDPTPPNLPSFGNTSNVNVLVASNSRSHTLSKRPPESAQRPPKSMTTSQDKSVATGSDNGVSILDVLAATDKILKNDNDVPTDQRDDSPAVNLLSDESAEIGNIASSPVPSDTGSEYVPFDTGPERSQLWDPSQDEIHNELDGDQVVVPNNDNFQIIQHATNHTPRKSVRKRPVFNQDTTSPRQALQTQESDGVDSQSGTEITIPDETEDEDNSQPDAHTTASTKAGRRIETQALFHESVLDDKEDITEFEVPPPEGGWDQFGELEDDPEEAQDIRTSVELPEHELITRYTSMLSVTEEEVLELVGEEESRKAPLPEKVVVVSDNESSHTTFSEDLQLSGPTKVAGLHKQQGRASSSSSRLAKTISSRIGSSPNTSLERDAAESSASEDQTTIELWFTDQPKVYGNMDSRIITRLASACLNATLFNLPAATFTMRDMVTSFEESEANRRHQFFHETRIKREYTTGTPQASFRPKTRLTENEAKALLPQAMMGVWTTEDDRAFLSQTSEGLEKVERKHGAKGVKKRAKFLKLRYGQEVTVGGSTPRSTMPTPARR